jgi:hypothetical protein
LFASGKSLITTALIEGSWDGIRLWTLDPQLRSFEEVTFIPLDGFVNGLQIQQNGQITLAAAVTSEPRLGRWMKQKAKSGIFIVDIAV